MSEATQTQHRVLDWRAVGARVLAWMHNTLMLVGCLVVGAAAYLYLHPQSLAVLGKELAQWVAVRGPATVVAQAEDVAQPALPDDGRLAVVAQAPQLTHAQSAIADWLSRRYNIAPLAMRELVSSAWQVGRDEHLDPTLILAVMAVESSFNPYAASSVGATGLMQVMAKVHEDKFAAYGGVGASLDPKANVRVGAAVLKNAIARGGSLQAGLRMYVGASSVANEGGYAQKVLGMQARLRLLADGAHPPDNAPLTAAAVAGQTVHTATRATAAATPAASGAQPAASDPQTAEVARASPTLG